MADKLKAWFDAEAGCLEVRFSQAAGYAGENAHDAVMEGVYTRCRVTGSRIPDVSRLGKDQSLEAGLAPAA